MPYNPGPQHFMCMLSRVIDGQQVAVQWPVVQIHGSRSVKPISLAVALADLQNEIIVTRDRREHDANSNPEDAAELARLEDTLEQMLGAAGLEEFLDIGVAGLKAAWPDRPR